MHGHAVPPALLAAAERGPQAFGGVEVRRTPEGAVLTFPGISPLRPIRPPMLDIAQRLAWLQAHGMVAQVVGPWLDAVGDVLPPEAHEAWSRRYNEGLAELCAQGGGRLFGLATLSLQRPEAAARELEHAVQRLGLVGAMLGTDIARVDLADAALAPLWEAATALRAPIVLHPTYGGPGGGLHPRSYVNLYGRLIDTTYTATRLILAGLFDRHPEVPIVLVHGGGFLPYQLERLDTCYAKGDLTAGHGPSVALQRERPSAYASCFFYDTALLAAPAARLLVETVGADRVMLGTDYPFPIADAGAVARLSQAFPDEAIRRRVLSANAERLFKLAR